MSLEWPYELKIESIEDEIGLDFDSLSFSDQDFILEMGLERWREIRSKED